MCCRKGAITMMKPPPAFASLEGLLQQDRPDGIDMRPTLLRVLTDLYLQKRSHPPSDERYYIELAMRLLDAADVKTRATLAARLAQYPAAPPIIIQRLARDVLEVARPVLEQSALLDRRRACRDRQGVRCRPCRDHRHPHGAGCSATAARRRSRRAGHGRRLTHRAG